jgi:N-acetylmuramoyl-L-alanine amidase
LMVIAMTKPNYTYKQDHIPHNTPFNRRPAIKMHATTITIHNNANPTSTAANERAWLTNKTNIRQASYHIAIDSKQAIEVLPLDEVGWHAGDGSGVNSGNRTSIGIEICERDVELGEYAQTLANAVELVATMLHKKGWGVDRLRRHYDWSGKNCPRLMNIDNKWSGWFDFKKRVGVRLAELDKRQEINVLVNGKPLKVKGEVKDGVTYVPLRAVGEALGMKVAYDPKLKIASISK